MSDTEFVESTNTNSMNCPSSHPYYACNQCWEDAAQALSGGCNDGDSGGDDGDDDSGNGTYTNAQLAIMDIEENLGIDIDDGFIEIADYDGYAPSYNTVMDLEDAKVYFRALLGTEKGNQLGDDLNTNGDGVLTRNEASMAKGADPLQVLNTGLHSGLAMDDILAYVGLYFGSGRIDQYAGDLGPEITARLATFTRTWQPNVAGRYGKTK